MGARRAAERLLRFLWTYANEQWYGVSTRSQGERVEATDAVAYETPDYLLLRKTARILREHLTERDVFYELGCGKGRVLAVMSRLPFARLVGIELHPGLAEIARGNSRRLRRRHPPIEIVCANVLDVDLDDGTVFFLFNPFGPDTTRQVVARLEDSISRQPRRVVVVYYNAVNAALFDDAGFLDRIHSYTTPVAASPVVLWKSTAGDSGSRA